MSLINRWNDSSSYYVLGLALGTSLLSACNLLTQDTVAPFLVTAPSAAGTVTVIADAGQVQALSWVELRNPERGQVARASVGDAGAFLSTFSATEGERVEVTYVTASGDTRQESIRPDETLVAVHGVITQSDPDGEAGDAPPCVILVRDDVAEGASDPVELVLLPPCGKPPQGEPPGDQASPPPEGSKPPCGCGHPPPAEGSAPPEGSTPPEGGQPPPGETPPPGGPHGAPPDLEPLVGEAVTVVGSFAAEVEEVPCAGAPFLPRSVVADSEL